MIQKKIERNWKPLGALGAITLFGIGMTPDAALAQRTRTDDERQQRREDRGERREDMTPQQRQQRMQQRLQNMTPAQRQQFQERMQQRMQQNGGGGGNGGGFGGQGGPGGGNFGGMTKEVRQRQVMIASGITDAAVQDAIIQFLATQERERQPLLAMARQLNASLVNPQTTAEQTTASLTAFRSAVAADKTRYDAALQELDAKIKYSTTPKVEAFLTLIGILGNEAPTVGGSSQIFAPAGPRAVVNRPRAQDE